jgi:2'-5' RNA ligase
VVSRDEAKADVIRCFIALPINDGVRAELDTLQNHLRHTGAHVSWARTGNIHLTLAFLGDVFESRVADLSPVLDDLGHRIPPFRFEVAQVGTFGSPRSPRVVWAGVEEESGVLAELHQELVLGLAGLDLSLEARPFRPHLTVGRVRSRRGLAELTSAIASVKNSRFGWVEAGRVLLMRSRLESQGARYDVLHASSLTGVKQHGGQSDEGCEG